MRSKEEANDYRYFPDPDLPPLRLSESFVAEVIEEIDILPWEAKDKLINTYKLSNYDAEILSRDRSTFTFFKEMNVSENFGATLSNFIINKVLPYCQEKQLDISELNKHNISALVKLLESGKVSKSAALTKLSSIVLQSSEDLDLVQLAQQNNLIQSENQDFLDQIIEEVINANPDKVKAFRNGKKGLLGFFMGQVMGKAKGKANPQILNTKLIDKLNT